MQQPGRDCARVDFLGGCFDRMPVEDVMAALRARTAADPFQYVVTPNVDHLVRLERRPELLPIYRNAWMSWCDSNPVRRLASLLGIKLPHVTGSDMMERVFASVMAPGDTVLAIVANDELLNELRQKLPQYRWTGVSPPVGFENDPAAVATLVRFVVEHPSRFIFIGVGSPRSEILAARIHEDGGAVGTAFCIGAALEFTAGLKKRAPEYLRRIELEWLHRLLSEPSRLWRRYILSFVPLTRLFLREIANRNREIDRRLGTSI